MKQEDTTGTEVALKMMGIPSVVCGIGCCSIGIFSSVQRFGMLLFGLCTLVGGFIMLALANIIRFLRLIYNKSKQG
jgi:hypothetical protein